MIKTILISVLCTGLISACGKNDFDPNWPYIGNWQCDNAKLSIRKDGTFSYHKENQPEVSGTYKMDKYEFIWTGKRLPHHYDFADKNHLLISNQGGDVWQCQRIKDD